MLNYECSLPGLKNGQSLSRRFDQWAWLLLDSQGSRPDFRCSQGVKHENLLGQDLDPGRGWKYRRLCSVPPLDVCICVVLVWLQ